MALYDYRCSACDYVEERLVPVADRDEQFCTCGEHLTRLISLPARTPGLWHDDWYVGLGGAGKYDRGLGMTIYSEKHRDRELAKRHLVRETDLPAGWWDSRLSDIKEEDAKIAAKTEEFKQNIKKYDGNKERAIVDTWPARECLKDD